MTNAVILLVEDNLDEELLTLRALRKNKIGDRVFVAQAGLEALDFLFCTGPYADRDPHDMPKLILLDIKLPKMDGFEVLRHIRVDQRTHLLPVVLLTASKEEQDLIEGYESGANSFMRKPVDYNQFEEFVGELSSYWLVRNVAPPR
jgi:two-component system, response regulator